jgi:hypothetical protein
MEPQCYGSPLACAAAGAASGHAAAAASYQRVTVLRLCCHYLKVLTVCLPACPVRPFRWLLLLLLQPPTRAEEVVKGDSHFRDRWRCMLSVDELVGAVMEALTELEVMERTYTFFSSDQ